ncbi:MAG: zinc metalloprotease HtpX [Chloroflexi bacterium]|nr:zinc metalloprotease HtpX [Chloroflexota bacterium]
MSNTIKSVILLGALTGLLVVMGRVLGGTTGMIVAFGMAVVMNFASYWFSDQIAMKMAGAREVSPEEAPQLHGIVEELAYRAGLPKPRVAIVESPSPNAFATGRDQNHALVAVTTGIQQILNRDELMAVLGHELGHVKNKDILISSIAATVAGAIVMIAHMLQFAAFFGGFGGSRDGERGVNPIAALGMIILAPLAATLIQMAISRSREYGADDTGAHIVGDPMALASALQKLEAGSQRMPMDVNPAAAPLFIVNPLSGQFIGNLFSTHPPISERIKRLQRMAGYPV